MTSQSIKCKPCGRCCLIPHLYNFTPLRENIENWISRNRFDILKYIDIKDGKYSAWVNPQTKKKLKKCPWLKKCEQTDKFLCKIHDAMPNHCSEFPHVIYANYINNLNKNN